MALAYIDPGTGYTIGTSILAPLLALLTLALGVVGVFFKRILFFLRRLGRWNLLLLAIPVLGLAGVTYSYFAGGAKVATEGRVIILGMDGMSPRVIEPLMKAGKVPNFSRLAALGGYRHLATTNPSQSPVAWTGFSTGLNPGRHGMFDFIRCDPKTHALALSTSSIENGEAKPVVTVKHFWDYATELGIESVILNCPVTFPPEKIKGRMLAGMGVPDILGTEGTFTFYTTEASEGKDTGGRVVQLPGASAFSIDLYGPKKQFGGGVVDNVKVPAVITKKGGRTVSIEIQGNEPFELQQGQWSGWKNVTFPLALFKKMKGIVKFYLVEVEPEFKLYATPINHDPRDPYFPIAYPAGYAKELAGQVGLYYTQGMPSPTWGVNEKRIGEEPFLQTMEEITLSRQQMLDYELGRMERGIVFAYFEATDSVQHMFWRYTDPKSPLPTNEKTDPRYRETIADWYEKMDAILGDVMSRLGPRDTLIVLSDHGFDAFRRAVHVNSWLRKHGYLVLQDNAAAEGGDLLVDVDWQRTRAYAVGFGSIYLNLPGGASDPSAAALKEEIAAKLKGWVDEKTGEHVIKQVYTREEIFRGTRAGEAPDLFVGFNSGYRASWQTATGGAPAALIEDNLKKWGGDHLVDPSLVPGILFANRKLAEHPSLYDLAPTILKAAGCSEEQIGAWNFDGKPLF